MNQFRFYFSNFVDIYNMTSNIGMETIYFSNSQLSCFYFCWAFCLLCRVTLEQVWVMDPSLPQWISLVHLYQLPGRNLFEHSLLHSLPCGDISKSSHYFFLHNNLYPLSTRNIFKLHRCCSNICIDCRIETYLNTSGASNYYMFSGTYFNIIQVVALSVHWEIFPIHIKILIGIVDRKLIQ